MIRFVANILAFEIGWSACVLGLAHDRAWLGPLVVACIAAGTLMTDRRPSRETVAVLTVAALGLGLDSILLGAGVLDLAHGPRVAGAPLAFFPVFFAMWVNFALLLNVSLRWLHGRWILAAVLGGVSAPPTYYLAQRFGAVELAEPRWLALATIGVGYALAVPAASWLARRLRIGAAPAPAPAGGQTA
ncbi:MAG: DUF2878 domain-containing protein [Phycisphaerales bacterium]